MKILMINKTDAFGGAAQVMTNLTEGLRLAGHNVRWLVRRKFTLDKNVFELPENFVFHLFRRICHRDFSVVWENVFQWNGFVSEILNHPLVNWADIIHCHNLHGNYFRLSNLVSLSQKKPLVWTWHDWWPVTGHCATPQICKKNCLGLHNSSWQEKISIYKKSNFKVVVPSLDLLKNMPELGIRTYLIPNGVVQYDLSKISKSELRHKLNLPNYKKIISYLPYPDKGSNFIGSLKPQFPNIYWQEIGGRKYLDQLTMQKYLKASDTFLFPSLAESFGMAPVEALCQGTPVVAFPVGVIPELINHKVNGYISKYNDFADLCCGLNFVLTHSMMAPNHKLLSTFSISSMTKNYLKIYNANKLQP